MNKKTCYEQLIYLNNFALESKDSAVSNIKKTFPNNILGYSFKQNNKIINISKNNYIISNTIDKLNQDYGICNANFDNDLIAELDTSERDEKLCNLKLNNINEYNRNYLRNIILGLIKYQKPVIVTGMLQFNPYDRFYTFINIKPFYPEYENQSKVICSHINISKRQIDAVLNLYGNTNYTTKPLVLICKPYSYKNKNNEERGGLNLTAELGVPGIMTYSDAIKIIPTIHKSKYINFMDISAGYLLGINPDNIKKERIKRKIHNRLMKKINSEQEEDDNQKTILFTTKDNITVTKEDPVFHIDTNRLNILKSEQIINLPKIPKNNNINILDGWFLKV